MNKLLSTQLCAGLKAWFEQNAYFVDVFDNVSILFKNVDSYYRNDVPHGEMTSAIIFPLKSETKSQTNRENGSIGINIVFNLGEQRTERGYQIYATAESVRAQLLDNPVYIQQFLSSNYVPGLMMINGQNVTDYQKLNRQIQSRQGVATLNIVLDYKISILLNQRALWKQGYDFYSPVTKIYNTIKNINVNTQILSNRVIQAYTVTTGESYFTNGTLFLPNNYIGKGKLLGNYNGLITNSILLTPTPPISKVKYLYVAEITANYPDTGMLIVSANALPGYSALLLGDKGSVYDIIYDDTWLSPIYHELTDVVISTFYPVTGSLLNKVQAESGNAGLLFGDDGNIYNVTVK